MLTNPKGKKDNSSSETEDSQDEDGEAISKKKKKKGQSQWVQEIEKDNACDKHPGQACHVLHSGSHHQLTMADKSLWGMMMVGVTHLQS